MADKHAAEAASLLDSFDDVSTRFERKLGEAKNSVDPKKLHELELLQKEWANFLQKGVKLEKEWGKEKTKDEKEYGKFVLMIKAQTRSSNAYKGQIDKIGKQGDGNAKKALAQMEDLYGKEVGGLMDRAETAITNMHHAIVREFPKAATANFRIAADILSKDVEPVLKNFDKKLAEFAAKNGVTFEYLKKEAASELKKIEALSTELEKRFKDLDHHLDGSRDELRALEEEAKEKESASTNKNASKQYTANLNKLLKEFKESRTELAKNLKTAEDALEEIADASARMKAENPEQMLVFVEKAAGRGLELFKTAKQFDKDWEAQLSGGAIKKKLAKYQIDKEDEKKFFKPVSVKAEVLKDQFEKTVNSAKPKLNGMLPMIERAATVASDNALRFAGISKAFTPGQKPANQGDKQAAANDKEAQQADAKSKAAKELAESLKKAIAAVKNALSYA